MSSVFISHSSDDNEAVDQVVEMLRRSGHQVWVDQSDLPAGSSLAHSIQDGISNADAFLLLNSKAAASSPWVELEWQAALSKSISTSGFKFLLAKLDDSEPPLLLQSKKWLNLWTGHGLDLTPLQEALGGEGEHWAAQPKPRIWYFDDEPEWTTKFSNNHRDAFRIRSFNSGTELLPALLKASKGHDELPDLLLMDYYTLRHDLTPERQREALESIENLVASEKKLREYVDAAWHPAGVDIVETVRDFYPPEQLPIAMHTQQGLILLSDGLIQELEFLGVEWLIKNRFSPETDRLVLDGIAKRAGHSITRDKPQVLIVDDNPKYIETFRSRQKEYYQIESISSEGEVMPTLSRMEREGRFPDLFLVDMYYPKDASESEEIIDLANDKLKEFAELESSTQNTVRECFEPLGLRLMRKIRQIIPQKQLPILVYSISGLVSVGDHAFQEIEKLGGAWLLKDRYDASTEEVMIYGEIFRSQPTPGPSNR